MQKNYMLPVYKKLVPLSSPKEFLRLHVIPSLLQSSQTTKDSSTSWKHVRSMNILLAGLNNYQGMASARSINLVPEIVILIFLVPFQIHPPKCISVKGQ